MILQKDRNGVYVKILFSALIAGNLLSFSAGAADDPAPFGFSWGPVGNVPVPSIARREDNVTQLIYYRDRLPSDELPDTDEIVLEVCKDQGLQQIVWISRPLSLQETDIKFQEILAEGERRYGRPDKANGGSVYWTERRTLMTKILDGGVNRILMISNGPNFDECSKQHLSSTGHSLSDHWAPASRSR